MQPMTDPVTELDLNAYVDGQLDLWQRARVEDYLSRHPDHAARVMKDLRIANGLRLALSASRMPDAAARGAAGKLARGFRRDRQVRRAARVLPVILLVGAGWLAHTAVPPLSASVPPPAFVDGALAARDAGALRLGMRSQPEMRDIDAAELRAATGITLPAYSTHWSVRDAQVFPSPQGPGIEIAFDTPDLGRVTAFAVRPGGFAVTLPETEQRGGTAIVWFQIGETAHVLIADGDTDALRNVAERLSRTLY